MCRRSRKWLIIKHTKLSPLFPLPSQQIESSLLFQNEIGFVSNSNKNLQSKFWWWCIWNTPLISIDPSRWPLSSIAKSYCSSLKGCKKKKVLFPSASALLTTALYIAMIVRQPVLWRQGVSWTLRESFRSVFLYKVQERASQLPLDERKLSNEYHRFFSLIQDPDNGIDKQWFKNV